MAVKVANNYQPAGRLLGSAIVGTGAAQNITTETAITGLAVTVTLPQAAVLIVEAHIVGAQLTTASAPQIRIYEDLAVDVLIGYDVQNVAINEFITLKCLTEPLSFAAGAHTFYATATAPAGTWQTWQGGPATFKHKLLVREA